MKSFTKLRIEVLQHLESSLETWYLLIIDGEIELEKRERSDEELWMPGVELRIFGQGAGCCHDELF